MLEQFFTPGRIPEILGFLAGCLYLWWEYRADPKMWFANLAMSLLSFWVYYTAGLYADFAMNIYYFLMAFYGYIAWTFSLRRRKKTERPISHIPLAELLWCLAAFVLIYAAIACWLVFGTDSTVPFYDAFTTALSIIATWMLARKYVEQWLAWLAVDAVCTGLYWYKDRPFYAVLYGIYTLIAIAGYFRWRRAMKASGEA